MVFVQEALVRKLIPKDKGKGRAKPTLKRKVGYGEEQLSATRAKLADMDVDRDNGAGSGGVPTENQSK